jgi:hypothetical protein
VKLALAVLRDQDGLIDLDVPVSGNVDDPNFRLGRVIWHAIVNVVTKVATAPFTMLAKLFGGGSEKLDVVDFEPGSSALTSGTEKSLQALAKALYSRPALRLDIEGSADESADGRALRLAELRRRARETKWKSLKNRAAATPTGAPADAGAAPKLTVTEMEERLLATIDLAPEAMRALAEERADGVRGRIAEAAQIDPARLFLVEGGERAKKEGGRRVYFTLK